MLQLLLESVRHISTLLHLFTWVVYVFDCLMLQTILHVAEHLLSDKTRPKMKFHVPYSKPTDPKS